MSDAPFTLSQNDSFAILKNLKSWHRPTVAQIRNCVLDGRFIIPGQHNDADTKQLTGMSEAFTLAVKAGRLFDLGHIPNSVLKSETRRAGELFVEGYIGHPFRTPYAFYHTWDAENVGREMRDSGVTVGDCGSLYVVDPLDWSAYTDGKLDAGTFMVCEAQGVVVFGKPVLLIGSMLLGAVKRHPSSGLPAYSVGQFVASALEKTAPGGPTESAICASLLDPIMSCMLLLATDGIDVRTVEAPEKLNRQRAKHGRAPIPAHYEVKAGAYVTALSTRGQRRSEAGSGHHASPVPHLRRGHIRHLHERHGGGTTFVRDAVINLRDPDAPLARSFYQHRMEEQATPPAPR